MWGFCPGTIVHHGLLIERAVGVCVCGGGGGMYCARVVGLMCFSFFLSLAYLVFCGEQVELVGRSEGGYSELW